MSTWSLSLGEARRIALTAQGFARKRPRSVTRAQLRRTMREIAVIQIDSVNVLVPAHYQPLFSRLGPYDRAMLDDLVYKRREFAEVWAHEASIVPTEHWRLLEHRRLGNDRRLRALAAFMEEHRSYAADVLQRVRTHGALAAGDVPESDGSRGKSSQWWGWTQAKAVLEGHFASGALAVPRRRAAGFAREYDLAERVLNETQRNVVPLEEGRRELLLIAARALGVATVRDLADYHRVDIRSARTAIQSMVADGDLQEVRVEEWREPAYMHPRAALPACVEAAAVLSPFDPLIWCRPRTERLFGFEYRIEIYVPEARRRFGYYVLPFLMGDRLVGRLDLKTDRASDRLLVRAAHLEKGIAAGDVADSLSVELGEMARWLGVSDVTCGRRGSLARSLTAALSRRR